MVCEADPIAYCLANYISSVCQFPYLSMSPIESFLVALGIGRVWSNQQNPPKHYSADGQRVHHYHIGLLGLLGSGLLYLYGKRSDRKPAKNVAAFATGLIVDDYADFKKDILDRI